MKREPWYAKFYEAYRIMFMVFGFGILYCWGLIFGTHLYDRLFPFSETKTELSPGELVDKAMAIPGAIVISPHRDLVEMGLVIVKSNDEDIDFPIKLCSPAIAVKTKAGYCIWSLGETCGVTFPKNADGSFVPVPDNLKVDLTPIKEQTGSIRGYQAAYDSFTKCVDEGKLAHLRQVIKKAQSEGGAVVLDPDGKDGRLFEYLSACTCSGGSDCDRCNQPHEEDHIF